MLRILAPGLALALSACAALAGQLATPIAFNGGNPDQRFFGSLEYLGGVELDHPHPDFGGFSGMELDGTDLIAVSDRGAWMTAQLVFEDGALVGLSEPQFAPFTNVSGNRIRGLDADAEAVTQGPDGALFVSFEREHRILRFPAPGEAATEKRTLPRHLRKEISGNSGMEGLLADGERLIAVMEDTRKGGDALLGVIFEDDEVKRFSLTRAGRYKPTDLAMGPDGETIYMIERSFNPLFGPGLRVRRFARDAVVEGARITGEELLSVGLPLAIDNMEALATRRGADGRTELLIMSDDNFNAVQRTLILHFAVVDREQ